MSVIPYLFFDGHCEEALNFYRDKLGAVVHMLMRFGESPEQPAPSALAPGNANKVMHASFELNSSTLMASDGHCRGLAEFRGFSLSLPVADVPTAQRYFDELKIGGEIQMPLEPTFFAEIFGMVKDQFGVSWMITVERKP